MHSPIANITLYRPSQTLNLFRCNFNDNRFMCASITTCYKAGTADLNSSGEERPDELFSWFLLFNRRTNIRHWEKILTNVFPAYRYHHSRIGFRKIWVHVCVQHPSRQRTPATFLLCRKYTWCHHSEADPSIKLPVNVQNGGLFSKMGKTKWPDVWLKERLPLCSNYI